VRKPLKRASPDERIRSIPFLEGWWYFSRGRWTGPFNKFDEAREMSWSLAPLDETEILIVKIEINPTGSIQIFRSKTPPPRVR